MTTLCLSHRKNEKCGLKGYVKIVLTLKGKKKTSSNEESINEVH
jgi:hypothetical protein